MSNKNNNNNKNKNNKNKNNKNENNNEENNENNISFLFNQNELNENGNKNQKNQKNNNNNKNQKNKNNNKNNNNRFNGLNNYAKIQKNMIGNETIIALLATTSFFRGLQQRWDDTPFSIKIGYLVILGALLYYHLLVQFHMYYALFFIIFISIILFLMNPYVGIVALIFLLLILYNQKKYEIKLRGTLFSETEIKNNKAYDGKKKHEYIKADTIPRELTTGVFSYSFWLYLNKPYDNQPIYRSGEWKSIFYRGSQLDSKDDIANLVQYPGVWIKPDDQTLAFVFKNEGAQNESVELPVEMNVWTHFLVNCGTRSVSIYKNGKLEVSSALLQNSLSMSDYGIYITSDYALAQLEDMTQEEINEEDSVFSDKTGFDGNLAYLSYYDTQFSPSEIEDCMNLYKEKVEAYQKYKESKFEPRDTSSIDTVDDTTTDDTTTDDTTTDDTTTDD